MKKVILAFAILLVAAFTVNKAVAQIGVRAGIGFSNIEYSGGTVDINPESKIGLSLGVSKEFKIIGQFLKLAPELMFDIRGQGESDFKLTDASTLKVGISYNYLGAGLGLKLKIPAVPVYVLAQPYYQYIIGGQQVVTDENGLETTLKMDDLGDIKRSELGLNLGLGTKLQLGPVGLFLEARYSIPMTTLGEYKNIETYDMKNKYFTVSVGFLIGGNDD